MTTLTFQLELITPCFCGGAEPDKHAEIRAPSIRGQLRWWFRTLGGFKSLADAKMDVRQQERLVFGSVAGGEGSAGRLVVRVAAPTGCGLTDSAEFRAPDMASPEGYFLFPLRQKTRQKSALPSFTLQLVWRGMPALQGEIQSLGAVLGHLGSIGFRGRRAMGAMAFSQPGPDLESALARFSKPGAVKVLELKGACGNASACTCELAKWLKSWRQHGRTPRLAVGEPGFGFARRDHNEGLALLGGQSVTNAPPSQAPKGKAGETFRPALGLPIIQFFSSQPKDRNKVNWEFGTGSTKGRFASPVFLRPHRNAQGKWHALVVFADAHQWPAGKKVYLNGQERNVSLGLYEAMKEDDRLKDFLA
jgi:CRISPR-associated protein Cmr1